MTLLGKSITRIELSKNEQKSTRMWPMLTEPAVIRFVCVESGFGCGYLHGYMDRVRRAGPSSFPLDRIHVFCPSIMLSFVFREVSRCYNCNCFAGSCH